MNCTKCGAAIEPGWNVCPACGASVPSNAVNGSLQQGDATLYNGRPPQNPAPRQGGFPQQNRPPQPNGFSQHPGAPRQGGFPQQGGAPLQTGYPRQNGYPLQGYPPQNGGTGQTLVPPAPDKKKNVTSVLIIVFAIVLVIATAVTVAILLLNNKDEAKPDETTTSAAEEAIAEPTEEVTQETIPVPSAAPSKYPTGTYRNRASQRINIRAGHSTGYDIIGKIPVGGSVYVSEVYEDIYAVSENVRWWGKVSYNGVTGWAAMYYMTPN